MYLEFVDFVADCIVRAGNFISSILARIVWRRHIRNRNFVCPSVRQTRGTDVEQLNIQTYGLHRTLQVIIQVFVAKIHGPRFMGLTHTTAAEHVGGEGTRDSRHHEHIDVS